MSRPIIDEIAKERILANAELIKGFSMADFTGSTEDKKEKISLDNPSYSGNTLIGYVKSVYNNWQLDKSDEYWIELAGQKRVVEPQIVRLLKTIIYCHMNKNMKFSAALAKIFMVVTMGLAKEGKIILPEVDVLGPFNSKTEEVVIREMYEWICFICEGNKIAIERPEVISAKAKSVKKSTAKIEDKTKKKTGKKKSAASALAGE